MSWKTLLSKFLSIQDFVNHILKNMQSAHLLRYFNSLIPSCVVCSLRYMGYFCEPSILFVTQLDVKDGSH